MRNRDSDFMVLLMVFLPLPFIGDGLNMIFVFLWHFGLVQ